MIRTILKRELANYLKNPIFYIGAIFILISVYGSVSPYLKIHYFTKESEIRTLEGATEISDSDIIDGYIPTTKEEQYQMGFNIIYDTMTKNLGMGQKDADAVVKRLKDSNMSIKEIAKYLEEKYSYRSAEYVFYDSKMKKATVKEANQYIRNALEQKTYSNYFSRKYADYFTLNMIFYAIVLFAFLYMRDSKKDIYELLHTKPVKPWQYIIGKIVGGMAAILLVVITITVIFTILVMKHGMDAGFPVSAWDLWFAVILYVLPNLFMVIAVYTGVSVLFKNPLPAVPVLVLYMIYSNMGSVLEDGSFGYKIRNLAILVRFPGTFFETVTPAQAVFNQLFLMTGACLIVLLGVQVWKRRRVY